MLERDAETTALGAALAELCRGRGGVAVIEGPPGIGRSALLGWLGDRAADAGLPVLAARGRELEGEGAIRDELLRDHGDAVPRGPHVLLVDDAQWADGATQAFVAQRAGRAADHPALVAVAIADGEPVGDALAWLRAQPEHRLVRPAPLSPAAVEALTGDAGLARASGGNPRLLALLRDADGRPSPALTAVAAGWLRRAGAQASDLAVAVAALGDDAALRHAAAVAGLELGTTEALADRLVALGVLAPGEPLRLTAGALTEAVRAAAGPFALGSAHRRAAAVLAGDGAPADVVARHLLASAPAGDPSAVAALRAAAQERRAAGDATAAARLLERAVAEPPERGERPAVLLELADAQLHAADPDAGARIDDALRLAAHDPQQRLGALVARARLLQQRGDPQGADRALQDVLDEASEGDPAADALLADQLSATVLDARLRPAARPRLDALLAAAAAGRPPRHPGLAAHAALETALRGGAPAPVRDLAATALAGDPLIDPATHGILLSLVVQALACVDALEEAERAASAGLAAAQARGAVIAEASSSFHRAIPRLHRGALDAAAGDLARARRAAEHGWSAADPWIGALLAHVQLERGDLAAARAALALADGVRPDDLGAPLADVARARVALAEGDPRSGRDLAETAGRALEERFAIAHPGLASWRSVAALARRAAGDRDGARRLAARGLDEARACQAPRSVGLALRTAAAVGPEDERVALLEEAVAVLAASPARLQHAHALADLGAALRRAGRADTAQPPLREALQLAAEQRAGPLAQRAADELRQTGARPRRAAWKGPAALTPSERRVAELAAEGLTNDQIAERLVVTAKTVQTHLTSAYRKLGIASRRELGGALASAGGP